jgi:hypothetical protein
MQRHRLAFCPSPVVRGKHQRDDAQTPVVSKDYTSNSYAEDLGGKQ